MTYGTKSVVTAVQAGREAASEIDQFLGGDGDLTEKLAPVEKVNPAIGLQEGFGDAARAQTKIAAAEERMHTFNPVDFGLCDGDACGEASRCLQCDLRLQINNPRTWKDFGVEREER